MKIPCCNHTAPPSDPVIGIKPYEETATAHTQRPRDPLCFNIELSCQIWKSRSVQRARLSWSWLMCHQAKLPMHGTALASRCTGQHACHPLSLSCTRCSGCFRWCSWPFVVVACMPVWGLAALTQFWSQKIKVSIHLFGGSERCLVFTQWPWTS